MADPTTINKLFATPTRGSDPGTWDTPVNNNSIALDGMLGGFTNIALAAATTFSLTVPTGSVAAGAGPNQSQNALIVFSGTLTGNNTVKFTLPGFYIVHNKCAGTNSFYVQLAPASGGGNAIGAVPGRKCHIFFDGTDVDYVDQQDPGTAYDLHGATGYPPWMNACTVKPYLVKDGTVYNISNYTALGALLGSTFGGNGVTTFGVPDELSLVRVGYDTKGVGRLTQAICGINGQSMGAAGGNQSMQQHNHTTTDNGHVHGTNVNDNAANAANPSTNLPAPPSPLTNIYNTGGTGAQFASGFIRNATTGISINNFGTGASQNVQPTIVSFLPLIKT